MGEENEEKPTNNWFTWKMVVYTASVCVNVWRIR